MVVIIVLSFQCEELFFSTSWKKSLVVMNYLSFLLFVWESLSPLNFYRQLWQVKSSGWQFLFFFFSFSTLDTSSHSLPWMKGLTTGVSMAVEVCDASQAGGVQVHSWRSEQKLTFRPVTRDRADCWKPRGICGDPGCQHGRPWLQVSLDAHAAVKARNGADSMDVHRLVPCTCAATEAGAGHW